MNDEILNNLLTKANECINTGNYDEAETLAIKLLAELEKIGESGDTVTARQRDTTHCEALITLSIAKYRRGDYHPALALARAALDLAEEKNMHGDIYVKALGTIGSVYRNLSDYPQALTYYQKALAFYEEIGNKKGTGGTMVNIGNVYADLGQNATALEYYEKVLPILDEIGEKLFKANALNSIGSVYQDLSDYPQSLTYLQKAIAINEEIGSKDGIAANLSNIGSVYANLSDYPQSLTYHQKALAIYEEIGRKDGIAINLGTIGRLYANKEFDGYDTDKAEEAFLSAIALFEDIGEKRNLYVFHKFLADLYETQERWKEHSIQFKKYYTLKEEVQSEDAHKQANLMEQRRQAAEREKEIELAKAAAAAKLTATTALLHRVLPESIATRMIAGEQDISDYFTSVTILFADIAGFTPISAGMPAYVVVRFLNYVFGTFDAIMKKHGCEKIKTIGDGYMAVAGAPIPCDDHAERMALAALEMQQDIQLPEEFKEYIPVGVDFGIRVGLHTGSVVGGVIGDERFVYDIYSDSVNTAARMESHGEADKIHVSHEYFIHLQNRFAMTKNTTHGITFEKRGEMNIKGKGMMKTYYLQQAN